MRFFILLIISTLLFGCKYKSDTNSDYTRNLKRFLRIHQHITLKELPTHNLIIYTRKAGCFNCSEVIWMYFMDSVKNNKDYCLLVNRSLYETMNPDIKKKFRDRIIINDNEMVDRINLPLSSLTHVIFRKHKIIEIKTLTVKEMDDKHFAYFWKKDCSPNQ
jgi:hypothetical protein